MISLYRVFKSEQIVLTSEPFRLSGHEIPVLSSTEDKPEIIPIPQKEKTELIETRETVQNLRQTAQQEAQSIRRQAYGLGYKEGVAEKLEDIQALIVKVEKSLEALQIQAEKRWKEQEQQLQAGALMIAERILQKKLQEDPLALLELTRQVMALQRNSQWVQLTVHDETGALLARLNEELAQLSPQRQITILRQKEPQGLCVLETPEGLIDASVFRQLANLKGAMERIDPLWEGKE